MNDNNQLPKLPPRKADSHKGTFGRVLLVGGSRGMSGAIALSAQAALRGGGGLVTVATPARCADIVASFNPCYMTISLPCDRNGRLKLAAIDALAEPLSKTDCLACGPGLGRSVSLDRVVESLYRQYPGPAVLDADALNSLASNPAALLAPAGPRILTPHPGEFARLAAGLAQTGHKIPGPPTDAARQMAKTLGVIVVLKGHQTFVTDGSRDYTNSTGNPGMATGGSGDVLTGVITALLAQGLNPLEAAKLGVFLHGLSGDLAAEAVGQISLTATDLIDFLPQSLAKHDA